MASNFLNQKITARSLLFTSAMWWLGYVIVQSSILHLSFSLPLWLSVKDALLTNVLLGLASYAMINLIKFYQPRQFLRLIDSIGMAILTIWVTQWLAEIFVSNDETYLRFLNQSFVVRCLFGWMVISLFATSASLWFYLRDQHENDKRVADNEKLVREAELTRLRQQLQPHFLFNSLNSISALAGTKPEQARTMIQQLSDFLRGTLKKDDQQFVPLKDELDHLQLYLEIEKVRFGHRLKTHIEHSEAILAMKLPSLLLQPIVENAIKFGLYDTIGEIVIRIIATNENNYLVVKIENPFDPETAKPRQGTGFGLNSVQRRLYLLFARHDLLQTTQDEVTFITTIKIPQAS
jgi:two-component system, LytTR family, sensor kinase